MFKRFLLSVYGIILFQTLFSQIPSGYYDSANGLSGDDLKAALHNIIDNHNAGSYDLLWEILPKSDEDPDNPNNFILLYTGRSIPKTSSYPDYNREHVWAKSHGGFGTVAPAGTDAHHLRPTDVSVNTDRDSKDFDEGGTQHSEATGCYYTTHTWEPRDEVKGDVARMMFYMATRYEGDVAGEPDLELVDYITDPTTSPIFGKLSTLIKWHNEDPVDDIDRRRNEVVYSYQQNRNPFIDHPEYVAQIWGGSGNSLPSISGIAINPAAPTSLDAVSVSATITDSDGSISAAELHWGLSSGSLTNTITMTVSSGNTYTTNTNIAAQADGVTVFYEIEATDNESGVNTSAIQSYIVNDGGSSNELLNEDFTTCPATGWLTYSVAGSENWECGTGYMQVNAFGSDVACDDWLISPAQNLDLYEDEILTFTSWTKYSDSFNPPIELMYSTNYSGSGDPSSANWTVLSATWSAQNSETTTNSGNIDVSGINGANVYFAFHYISSGTGSGSSALWEIDDVIITGNAITNESPSISNIQKSPASPTNEESVTISATITDSDGSISSAVIKWGTSTGSYPNTIAMTGSDNSYSGTIGAQAAGTTVYFIIEATDNESAKTTSAQQSYVVVSATNENPVISGIAFNPTEPESAESVTVTAIITDSDGSITTASVKWGTTTGTYSNTVNMSNSGDNYSGIIPAQANGTNVYFIISATDNSGGNSQSAEYDYEVFDPTLLPPAISNVSINPANPTADDNVIVSGSVSDDDGTIETVILKWKVAGGTFTDVNMNLSGDKYYGQIPKQSAGTTINYSVVATDNDSQQATQDGVYTVSQTNGITDITNQKLKLYPNPVKNILNISIQDFTGSIDIKIYDILGKMVYKEKLQIANTNSIKLDGLDSGIYFINFEMDNKLIECPLLNLRTCY